MGGARDAFWREEMRILNLTEKGWKGVDWIHVAHGTTVLKRTLQKEDGRAWTGFMRLTGRQY